MQIEKKDINELVPAPYNPRKISKNKYEELKKSIEEFGYVEPIIWNERTGYVIGGQQRLKVLKAQSVNEVECVVVNYSEEKEKALNVTLNKISGKWDMEKLTDLFDDLKLSDIDLSITGFNDNEIKNIFDSKETSYFGDEREKTYNTYLLNEYDNTRVDGYYQMPIIKVSSFVPDELIGFNYVRSCSKEQHNHGVHFFLDDYQFERLWNRPDENIKLLKKFSCVLTPDFSLYLDMPIAMKIWNIYRSRLIGQMMQDKGINVIPTLSWAEEETFKFCFDGLEHGGVVAVSTVGVMRDKEARKLWSLGMSVAIKKLKPEVVICYGSKPEFDFGEVNVKYIPARNFGGKS